MTLIPVDEWYDDTNNNPWLPSFVLPRDPAVVDIIRSARRYLIGIEDDPSAGFDGYQAVDPKADVPTANVDAQVRAGEAAGLRAGEARLAAERSALAAHEAERAAAQARSRLAEAVGVPVTALRGIAFAGLDGSGVAVAPGGLGAREAVLKWALTPQFVAALGERQAGQVAILIALTLRVTWTAAEIVVGVPLYIKKSAATPPPKHDEAIPIHHERPHA